MKHPTILGAVAVSVAALATAADDHFVVSYDGANVLDARDETFKEAGKVGLWTKADSVIEFDDFTVEAR